MAHTGTAFPVIWLESGLHNTPKKLNTRLREELKKTDAERVLLAMGFCGNSLAGLKADGFEIIVPKADDCISLLLGSVERRMEISQELAAYFLTEGWMQGEWNLWAEYQHSVQEFGEETAQMIAQMMYGHYRTLGILHIDEQPLEPLVESSKIIAVTLHLNQQIIHGTLSWLEELLTGPWNNGKYLVIPDQKEITMMDMVL